MSRGRLAVLTIVLVVLVASGIGLVASVLARAVQDNAPLPPLSGQASPMMPAGRPTLVVRPRCVFQVHRGATT